MRSGAVRGWWRVRPGLVSPDLQSNLSSLEHSDARFTLDGRAHSPPGASIGSGSWILGWWRRVRQTWGQRIKPPFPFMICDPGPVENPGFCPDRHTAVAPRTCSLEQLPTTSPGPPDPPVGGPPPSPAPPSGTPASAGAPETPNIFTVWMLWKDSLRAHGNGCSRRQLLLERQGSWSASRPLSPSTNAA